MNEIEKAIETLRCIYPSKKEIMSGEYPEVADSLDLAVEALERQLTDRWIPVSERLPENRFYENGEPIEYNVMLRRATNPTTLCIDNHGFWFDWRGNYYNIASLMSYEFDVIAWRPLPEMYKEV